MKKILSVILFFLTACASTTPAVTPQLVKVYITSSAQPRLADLYNCASVSAVINLSDPQTADVLIRVGEPDNLLTPAFQIGTEDILVAVHPQTGVSSLTIGQARQLFTGQATNWKDVGGNDMPVQVWTYSPDDDAQQIFNDTVLAGQPVTSLARLAVSAQAMSDAIGAQAGSVGVLTRRWKAGNTREALIVASVPVLAITKSEPQGALKNLIACLQK
ncbi:MAG: substrate-binding domain-containing protein [Chloroflexi bacterium]|nr:substrate-binding domain-containing protein [Chloroflexota bacterium]MBI3340991.1 substrate-binding domain-containing protein [Chloroflexota bacterium]